MLGAAGLGFAALCRGGPVTEPNPLDPVVAAAKADPRNWVKNTLADINVMMTLAQLRLDDFTLFRLLDVRLKDEAGIANRQSLLSAVKNLADMMAAERRAMEAQPPPPEDVIVTDAPALAYEPDLLNRAARLVHARGLSGEDRSVKLLFLCVQSRLLGRIVSAAVKGPSSAGKSWTVDKTLELFPPEAYYKLTAFSEHALAYSAEPVKNRMLVLYEAESMNNEFSTYLLRSLLSEGEVRYETVEKTPTGLQARLIHREGPTGLILTTTKVEVHAENETRLVSLATNDSRAQTARVMMETARQRENGLLPPSVDEWWQLQRWLAGGDVRVAVPFALALAKQIPPLAVRLRRDFNALISLVQAHALLHRGTRDVNVDGHVVADLDLDYEPVRELLEPVLAEALGVGVPLAVRETVDAVRTLKEHTPGGVSTKSVATYLQIDRSAAQRRLQGAARRDFVFNNESRRGQPAKWEPNPDVVPDDVVVLPAAKALREETQ